MNRSKVGLVGLRVIILVVMMVVALGAGLPNVQAADGPRANGSVPLSGTLQPATISANFRQSCAIRTDGSLQCWGSSSYGQSTPPAGSFVQVDSGYDFSCAIRADGTLACWGDSSYGQATPPSGTFRQVSAGDYHACAVKDDGSLACWGAGGPGMSGFPHYGQATPPAGSFLQVTTLAYDTCGLRADGTVTCWGAGGPIVPPTGLFRQISGDSYQLCGVKTDGSLTCWGTDDDGETLPPSGTFTQVSMGMIHACGLRVDGTAVCWGDNAYGQSTPPTGTFTQIVAGSYHTCGLRNDGSLTCWGMNDYNQATAPAGSLFGQRRFDWAYAHGCGVTDDGSLACWGSNTYGEAVPPSGIFTQVVTGVNHNCGLKSDGSVVCWGDSTFGQLSVPSGNFQQLAAGYYHTCGVRNDGSLACWGRTNDGQTLAPTGTFTQVSSGGYHSCALNASGSLVCWGNNTKGQSTPPSGTFTKLALGEMVSCAIAPDGALNCWGNNSAGQASPPTGNFVDLSVSWAHGCGLKSDGTVACWGSNSHGQATPPAGTFAQIKVASSSSCGLRPNNTLTCWGTASIGAPFLTISPSSLSTGVVGAAYSQTLTTVGTAPYNFTLFSGSLPPGLNLSSAGVLQGTPTTQGSYTFMVTASDSRDFPVSGTRQYTLVINPNTAPVANSQSVSTNEDVARAITLTASDAESNPLTWTVGTPGHGTLSGTAPNLTYTPAANWNGTDTFTFYVNDGMGNSNTATVTITVASVNDLPVANSQSVSTNEDVARAITLTASDAESNPLTWTVGTPGHGTLSGTAPNLTYTPAANWYGTDTFTFYVNDGMGNSNTATVTITVASVNDLPVANSQSVSTNEDVARAITLTASDAESNPLTWTVGTPGHGTLSGTAPNLTYTPDADWNGTDAFNFNVYDGDLISEYVWVTIDVLPVNDVPVAQGQMIETGEDLAVAIVLVGIDVDGEPLTWTVGTPGHGTLSGTAPNLTYTPAVNWNGTDTFTFSVNDGTGDSNTATVTITVAPVNDAPVANNQSVSTNEDAVLGITLTASDFENDPLTWTVGTPGHGTLSGTAPNLTYTPDADWNGTDTFTFFVNDGTGDSNTATVTIDVAPINDAPVANNLLLETEEDEDVLVTLTASDADGNPVTWTVGTPGHGTLSGMAPNLTYTPDADWNGTDTFTFFVNDGTGDSNTATVTVEVAPVNDAPVAQGQAVETDWNVAVAIVLVGVDLDGDQLNWNLSEPSHGTLSGIAPNLVYTPAAHWSGIASFTFYVDDGELNSDPVVVTVEVNPAANLLVVKTVEDLNGGGLYRGDTLRYTIEVTNPNASDVVDLVVSDDLPDEVTFVSAQPEGYSAPNPVVWSIGTLEGGETWVATIDVTINSDADLVSDNVAIAIGDSCSGTSQPVSPGIVTRMADLWVTQQVQRQLNTVTYIIQVGNHGPDEADNASLLTEISLSVHDVTWTCVAANGAECANASGVGNVLDETIVLLPSGGTATYTLVGTLPVLARDSNTVWLTIPSFTEDPDLSNNQTTYLVKRLWLSVLSK